MYHTKNSLRLASRHFSNTSWGNPRLRMHCSFDLTLGPFLVRVPVSSHDHGLWIELRRDLIRNLVQEPHPVYGRVPLRVEAKRVPAPQSVVRLAVLVDVGGGQEGSCSRGSPVNRL